MTKILDGTTLFLEASGIRLIDVAASEATYPYIDFNFEEGDLRSEAVLTLNVEENEWHGVIRIAEDEVADFDDGMDASPEQIAALKASLPEDANDKIEAFKARHGSTVTQKM